MRGKTKKHKLMSLMKLYSDVCDESGIKRGTVKVVLDTLWPVLRQTLTEGYEIRIPNFGTWQQRPTASRLTKNVNDRRIYSYTPENRRLIFKMDPVWKREHFDENAVIPPPEEYVNIKYPISYRAWKKIEKDFGTAILNEVYRKLYDKPEVS